MFSHQCLHALPGKMRRWAPCSSVANTRTKFPLGKLGKAQKSKKATLVGPGWAKSFRSNPRPRRDADNTATPLGAFVAKVKALAAKYRTALFPY
jgi:hypothetical protein